MSVVDIDQVVDVAMARTPFKVGHNPAKPLCRQAVALGVRLTLLAVAKSLEKDGDQESEYDAVVDALKRLL